MDGCTFSLFPAVLEAAAASAAALLAASSISAVPVPFALPACRAAMRMRWRSLMAAKSTPPGAVGRRAGARAGTGAAWNGASVGLLPLTVDDGGMVGAAAEVVDESGVGAARGLFTTGTAVTVTVGTFTLLPLLPMLCLLRGATGAGTQV